MERRNRVMRRAHSSSTGYMQNHGKAQMKFLVRVQELKLKGLLVCMEKRRMASSGTKISEPV